MPSKSKKPDLYLPLIKKLVEDISEIRTAVGLMVASDTLVKSINKIPKNTFPKKTAKEIITETNNSVPGGKILYSGLTGWYENEDFYTKETCRPISMDFTEILHKGKTWNEVNKLGAMFNFAEIVYLLAYNEEFRKMISSQRQYTWTSSRFSDGSLVSVGDFDSKGADVDRWEPGAPTRTSVFASLAVNND